MIDSVPIKFQLYCQVTPSTKNLTSYSNSIYLFMESPEVKVPQSLLAKKEINDTMIHS